MVNFTPWKHYLTFWLFSYICCYFLSKTNFNNLSSSSSFPSLDRRVADPDRIKIRVIFGSESDPVILMNPDPFIPRGSDSDPFISRWSGSGYFSMIRIQSIRNSDPQTRSATRIRNPAPKVLQPSKPLFRSMIGNDRL